MGFVELLDFSFSIVTGLDFLTLHKILSKTLRFKDWINAGLIVQTQELS